MPHNSGRLNKSTAMEGRRSFFVAAMVHLVGATGSCRDDPSYFDAWRCTDWSGYACRSGGWGVSGDSRIAALVLACPVSCTDVTPECHPPSPPPSPLPPPSPSPSVIFYPRDAPSLPPATPPVVGEMVECRYGEEVVDSFVDGTVVSARYRICANATVQDYHAHEGTPYIGGDLFYLSHASVLIGNPTPGDILELELEPMYAVHPRAPALKPDPHLSSCMSTRGRAARAARAARSVRAAGSARISMLTAHSPLPTRPLSQRPHPSRRPRGQPRPWRRPRRLTSSHRPTQPSGA